MCDLEVGYQKLHPSQKGATWGTGQKVGEMPEQAEPGKTEVSFPRGLGEGETWLCAKIDRPLSSW